MRILLGDDRSQGFARVGAALLLLGILLAATPVLREARAQGMDSGPNAVELKTAIERHYAEKIRGLLAPSFKTPPAVSVEVQLDLDAIRTSVTKKIDAGQSVETVVKTPGAILKRSIAVAVPAEELPVGFGLSTFRSLIEKGVGLGPDDQLELVAMPFQSPPATTTVDEADDWVTVLAFVPAAKHVLWAVVALVLGVMCWSSARRFADREPANLGASWPGLALAQAPVAPTAVAPQPEPPPAPEPSQVKPSPAPKPKPMSDPVTAIRRAAERDPARVADALRGWIQP